MRGVAQDTDSSQYWRLVQRLDRLENARLDTLHVVGNTDTGLATAFGSGWNHHDATRPQVAFYKDPVGIVRLQGVAENSAGTGGATVMFTLPDGYRPGDGREHWFGQFQSGSASHIEIDSSGHVLVAGATSAGGVISLDGITFRSTP